MQEGLQRQPFRGEAVEERDARDRERADEERRAAPRHPPQEPTEPVELEPPGRPLENPGGKEEQRLERCVVDGVQQGRAERERRPLIGPVAAEQETRTEPQCDDAEVLHGRVCEEPLEVALEQRVGDAAERGQSAQGEHGHADPGGHRAEPIDEDADEAVGGDRHHDAAHQGGDVRRGDRVGTREPGVHRHQPGLRPEADDRRDRNHGLDG